MLMVNLQEAKAKLNFLVEASRRGEQVVLMRGSQVVATIQPLEEGDLEMAPRLTDSQAQAFWNEVENTKTFSSPEKAVDHLKKFSHSKK